MPELSAMICLIDEAGGPWIGHGVEGGGVGVAGLEECGCCVGGVGEDGAGPEGSEEVGGRGGGGGG